MHQFTVMANLHDLLESDDVPGMGGEKKTNKYKEAMFSTIDYTLNRNISDPVGSEHHFKSFFLLNLLYFFFFKYIMTTKIKSGSVAPT